ncbi:aspartate kinase [Enterococcus sp. JM4C]|uniref:aspartate kinase n=1 Tax=Candidatus Enterococcus huntleyi TaxID=1857217 RepID=UPI00137A3BDB|nr:aspartate kinase [Enterococcus sp. JM4C]KAF1296139.1 aspartate kinase [Enterococcus sp. JM4C]
MKVVKFGGSSLASASQLEKVIQIIKEDAQRKFVVVSAPGKRTSDDTKVTDLLIAYYEATINHLPTTDLTTQIKQRYQEIADAFQVDSTIMTAISQNIDALQELDLINNPHLADTFLASGENNNAKLVAGILQTQGLAARYISPKELGLLVSDEPGNARILQDSYAEIYKWRDEAEILVIPGFFGYTEDGQVCTFSRGGSDITGSIIAAGMNVDLYENFTDVDGIYVSHPGYVHQPETIKELTYREMRELAYAGFSVFHDEALMPSYRAKIPVVIKNTNNPQHPGTLITTKRDISKQAVVGIASDQGFASIYISKYLMNREIGFVRRILQIFEELSLSYEHMPSGIDDVSIILRERQLTKESEEELMRRLAFELDPDELRITHNLSMIMVVGEGMRQRIGVTAESTSALARKEVNLEMINQGSSEVSIMFGIQEAQEEKAIRALYYTFFD